ncbi:MAG: VOC family protein, partial [Promethearchaeota archaeon]|jgi:hypothetical protein
LGFVKNSEIQVGKFKWLTVISPEGTGDIELLLEPNNHPAAKIFQNEIFKAGIPATTFFTKDIQKEYKRMIELGVQFTMQPTKTEWGFDAIFNDTCGNLINIHQLP